MDKPKFTKVPTELWEAIVKEIMYGNWGSVMGSSYIRDPLAVFMKGNAIVDALVEMKLLKRVDKKCVVFKSCMPEQELRLVEEDE